MGLVRGRRVYGNRREREVGRGYDDWSRDGRSRREEERGGGRGGERERP